MLSTVDAATIRLLNTTLGKGNPRFQPLEEGTWHAAILVKEFARHEKYVRLDGGAVLLEDDFLWLRIWKDETRRG